jgi:dihydrofolate synthase/folylpolyglutamate synthase
MESRSLQEWLVWQESLHRQPIELGLERIRKVADRLELSPPAGSTFTLAGTNGKGSCVALLESALLASGRQVGVYTSPHLLRYNERVRLGGAAVDEETLVGAFEAVERARRDVALTFFEFGTLAALWIFSRAGVDAWVLEVGMGGRLDAVNLIDTDFAMLTTVDLDHQEWLGETREIIAQEKAGIMRGGGRAFFADRLMQSTMVEQAMRIGSRLSCIGDDFDYQDMGGTWAWHGADIKLEGLYRDPLWGAAQLRNASLVLAALEAYDARLLDASLINRVLMLPRPPGRFQQVRRQPEWILDVAHNLQAAKVLRDQLRRLPQSVCTTAVIGMLTDKHADSFVAVLMDSVERWVTCTVDDKRALDGNSIGLCLRNAGAKHVHVCATPDDAIQCAAHQTPLAGRILVTGSFRIVGPALRSLDLY